MILRPARAVDAPTLVAILAERYPEMRYAGTVAIDETYARKVLSQASFKHGHTNDGGMFLMVAEDDASVIQAFMLAFLSRVYLFGDKLWAQDGILMARKDAPARAASQLIDAFMDWASDNPKVVEINTSWTDIMPTGPLMDRVYRAKGFVPCGAIYRRDARLESAGETE